jgi:uncharacterized protein (TIGR02594 family)
MTKFPRDLGKVSAKHESGGRGVDFVSNGRKWSDPGGDSYGIHQLSGNYSMGAFLRSEWGKPYRGKFKGLKPNTNAFNRKYKTVARADPEDFAYAQKAFYANTHYLPLREFAEKKGFNVTDRGVQETLFSLSVQHGKARLIVLAAAENGISDDPEDQIRELFKERTDYVNGLRSLKRRIKRNIANRYKKEVEECVALVGEQVEEPKPEQDNTTDAIIEIIRSFFETTVDVAQDVAEEIAERLDRSKYNGFSDVKTEPVVVTLSSKIPWLETAKSEIGLKEIPGRRHNKEIMSWSKEGLPKWIADFYTKDEIPWCGLWIAHLMVENNIKVNIKNPLSARAWNKFGVKCSPQLGAIMVFSRKGGGHVGLYISEDSKYYHILGGNQSNMVNVTKIAKSRFLGARWPKNYPTLQKKFAGRIKKSFDGKVSYNES